MKGRLSIAVLNKLVDSFNTAFKKKYETIRLPKRSIKPKDIEYYSEWKREENTEPKGNSFQLLEKLLRSRLRFAMLIYFRRYSLHNREGYYYTQ